MCLEQRWAENQAGWAASRNHAKIILGLNAFASPRAVWSLVLSAIIYVAGPAVLAPSHDPVQGKD